MHCPHLDRQKFVAVLAAFALTACGGGGGGDGGSGSGSGGGSGESRATAPTPVASTNTLGCAANTWVLLRSGGNFSGKLLNNVWNVGGGWQLSLVRALAEKRRGSTLAEVGWTWRWPDNGNQIWSDPSIGVGAKPWDGGPGNDARFPRRIAITPHRLVSYDVDTTATGNVILATSRWFKRTVAAPATAAESEINTEISTEIMIWSDYTPALLSTPGPVAEGGEITVDGRFFRVFAAESWGDISGGSTHR